MSAHATPQRKEFRQLFVQLLGPEAAFYRLILVYSIAISLLTLALPVSVQMLVDTVANIALPRSVVMIAAMLFALLLVSGILYAFRAYTMELFTRRIYARLSSEIALTALQAEQGFFEDQNRQDLMNRYFDIMSLKRNVPYVLSNGFTLILQSAIGFTLVSFYHLYLFIFCLGLVILLWLIWALWGWSATTTAFDLSAAKHRTGAWLQTLAVNNGLFKTPAHSGWALSESDRLINEHVDCQARHFRYNFRLLLSMLFLYAAASAILLGIGGLLVIRGELTLGQLVAAELIMSAIFVGLPQMAGYLTYYFNICAAIEELGQFQQVRTESTYSTDQTSLPAGGDIWFRQAHVGSDTTDMVLNLRLPGDGITLINAGTTMQRHFTDLLKRYRHPRAGSILLGDRELSDFDSNALRQQILVIDRPTLLAVTIRDYLGFYSQPESPSLHSALATVGLDRVVAALPGGYDTRLSQRGWPLSFQQAVRLKMAAALLSGCRIVVLGDVSDIVAAAVLTRWAREMRATGATVLIFSSRQELAGAGHRLVLAEQMQVLEKLSEETTAP